MVFFFGPGEWDALAVVIGLMLLFFLSAHHRAAPSSRTPRAYLLRGAFGATSGLALCIAVAPLIAIFEPRLASWLDRPRRRSDSGDSLGDRV